MNYGFENFANMAQDAMAPVSELAEFGFSAIEKGFQLQAELLGDAIDLAVDEMKLLSSATGPSEYFEGQVALAGTYAKRAQQRVQGLAATATEAQATMATWAEQGVKQAQALFADTLTAAQAAAPKPAARKAA